MKLISKTLLYYLLLSLPLLVLAGFFSYYLISQELKDGLDESLLKEKSHLEKAITKSSNPLSLNNGDLTRISIAAEGPTHFTFKDIVLYDSLEKENINYRVISGYFKTLGKNYHIEILKPSLEEEELMEGLFSAFSLIGAFLVLSFFILSWLLSKTLWKPFYATLEKLSNYEIKNHAPESFESTATEEFNQLNTTLNKMTHKIHSDFLQQKEFTENASHEMQTPLAIIKAHISLLIQSPHLKVEEMNSIQAIDNTTKKLAALNKALLLLAKIDNNQFKETSSIDISEVVSTVILHFADLLEAKQIVLENQIRPGFHVNMNPVLAEVLLSNLLQNSIRHNFIGGSIKLEIVANEFRISNSGESLKINAGELFTRFKKNEASKESLGLGLAIVKSICILYNIHITYTYNTNTHSFTLNFFNS